MSWPSRRQPAQIRRSEAHGQQVAERLEHVRVVLVVHVDGEGGGAEFADELSGRGEGEGVSECVRRWNMNDQWGKAGSDGVI